MHIVKFSIGSEERKPQITKIALGYSRDQAMYFSAFFLRDKKLSLQKKLESAEGRIVYRLWDVTAAKFSNLMVEYPFDFEKFAGEDFKKNKCQAFIQAYNNIPKDIVLKDKYELVQHRDLCALISRYGGINIDEYFREVLKEKGSFTLGLKIFLELVNQLEQIHTEGKITHGNLKAANVYVEEKKDQDVPSLMIRDFALAKKIDDDDNTAAIDILSLGNLFSELLSILYPRVPNKLFSQLSVLVNHMKESGTSARYTLSQVNAELKKTLNEYYEEKNNLVKSKQIPVTNVGKQRVRPSVNISCFTLLMLACSGGGGVLGFMLADVSGAVVGALLLPAVFLGSYGIYHLCKSKKYSSRGATSIFNSKSLFPKTHYGSFTDNSVSPGSICRTP